MSVVARSIPSERPQLLELCDGDGPAHLAGEDWWLESDRYGRTKRVLCRHCAFRQGFLGVAMVTTLLARLRASREEAV